MTSTTTKTFVFYQYQNGHRIQLQTLFLFESRLSNDPMGLKKINKKKLVYNLIIKSKYIKDEKEKNEVKSEIKKKGIKSKKNAWHLFVRCQGFFFACIQANLDVSFSLMHQSNSHMQKTITTGPIREQISHDPQPHSHAKDSQQPCQTAAMRASLEASTLQRGPRYVFNTPCYSHLITQPPQLGPISFQFSLAAHVYACEEKPAPHTILFLEPSVIYFAARNPAKNQGTSLLKRNKGRRAEHIEGGLFSEEKITEKRKGSRTQQRREIKGKVKVSLKGLIFFFSTKRCFVLQLCNFKNFELVLI